MSWEARLRKDPILRTEAVIFDASNDFVAVVWGGLEQKPFCAHADERARLMSAAPELYDSLYEIMHYKGGAESALSDEYVTQRALAAIKKANGGAE